MLKQRLDKGIELYKIDPNKKMILSGDDGADQTDEISIMKAYCIKKGIDSTNIIVDKHGYDTYKTAYRAKNIFHVDTAIFIRQAYHLKRAIFLGNKLSINSCGLIADQKKDQ